MKKNRFAVVIEESGREKLYLKRFLQIIKEDFSFLREENVVTRNKAAKSAKFGDVIVFGTHKRFDYTTVSSKDFDEDYDDLPLYSLSAAGFSLVKKQLKKYVRNSKYYKLDRNFDSVAIILDNDFEDDYYVCNPRYTRTKYVTKNKKSPKKSKLVAEEVQVFRNYAQVGWDIFEFQYDVHNDPYIIVDGNVYWIERDSSGKGRLTV